MNFFLFQGFPLFYCKFQLSFERLKLYNMDAAIFIKTVLADDLADEIEYYNISDSESNNMVFLSFSIYFCFFNFSHKSRTFPARDFD